MRLLRLLSCFVALWIAVSPCSAQQPPGPPPSAQDPAARRQAEYDAAVAAANAAMVKGPKIISLAGEGVLRLPAGTDWVPRAEADRFQQATGHSEDPGLLGIITDVTDKQGWMAIVRTTQDGYVKDDDARDIDPAAILADLRDGQAEENARRTARGFPALVLDEWLQPPSYDATAKRLVWALPVRVEGETGAPTINYNTRALGRAGYFSLNLLTDKAHFEAGKATAQTLLAAISFAKGHRYIDFDPSTDRVAAYGLAALIGVVALKKLGLLAVASAFVLKFAKLGIVAAIALVAGLKRLWPGRRRDDRGA